MKKNAIMIEIFFKFVLEIIFLLQISHVLVNNFETSVFQFKGLI